MNQEPYMIIWQEWKGLFAVIDRPKNHSITHGEEGINTFAKKKMAEKCCVELNSLGAKTFKKYTGRQL